MFDFAARCQWATLNLALPAQLGRADLLSRALGATMTVDVHDVSIRVLFMF
jgi:hypothetical protein